MAESASVGVLLDHAQDIIVVLDDGGQFTYANNAVERTLGYDVEALMGQNAFEYIHPDDVEAAIAAFQQTVDSDGFTEATAEFRFRAADDSWTWLQSRMSNLTDEVLDGYVVSSRDITDRVEAERDRLKTAQRLEELAETTGDVLWLVDGGWAEVLFINPAYEELYGGSIAELEADPTSFMETIHPDDRPAVRDAMECLAGGERVDMEYRVNPEQDYDTWVWAQGQPIVEDGEVVRIAGFARDLTDRRRRERQLYVMDNLLRHNLRNDLNVVLGTAALIEDEVPEVGEKTAVIRRTGDDLLASAQKEREVIDLLTRDPSCERLDVVAAISAAVDQVRERFPAATITVDCPDGLAVYALGEVGAAVVELLENAIQHADGDAPSVRIKVRSRDDFVSISISDDGPPIPQVERDVLAGEHDMDDIYHSSGLGLWLVHWIVDLSDGHVDVAARSEGGNRVSISLPRARSSASACIGSE